VIGQIEVSSCILHAVGWGKAGRTPDEPVIGRYLMEMSPKYELSSLLLHQTNWAPSNLNCQKKNMKRAAAVCLYSYLHCSKFYANWIESCHFDAPVQWDVCLQNYLVVTQL